MKQIKRSPAILLGIGFLLGLVVRYSMLSYIGTFDMDAYYEWGRKALEHGVPKSYHGIYFPLQYQFFEACAWVVARTQIAFFTVFKLSNLLFDVGSFVLLVLLLLRHKADPAYALIYWLHPWFLAVFELGYIDFQFTFFVLLTLWLLRGQTIGNALAAGVPLSFAFLMKPQAQILVVATFFYVLFRYLRTKELRPVAILAASVFLFVAYEIYFIRWLPRPRYVAAWVLPSSYLNITNVMPALTAQMTNVWYPVAYLLKQPGQPIYSVSDQIQLLPFLPAKHLAAALVLAAVGFQVFQVEREEETSPSENFARIFGFATLLVPFLMTSGHENHLFLGSVLLVLVAAKHESIGSKIAVQLLLLAQFLNIFGLYGTHPQWLANLIRPMQSDTAALVYSVLSVICFGFLARLFWVRRSAALAVS